jgi:hypothetical protein
MDLKIHKIYRHGEDNAMVYLAIETHYGYRGDMFRDILQINYNGKKRDAFITVKMRNPGIGLVIERIVEFINTMDLKADSVKNPPLEIIETLGEKLNLRYDRDMVMQALEGMESYVRQGSARFPAR